MKRIAGALGFFLLMALALGTIQASPAAALSPAEQTYVDKVNALRTSLGIKPLLVDAQLSGLAHQHDLDMAAAGRLYHDPNLGLGVTTVWAKLGENVGTGPVGSDIMAAFVASPGHYANLVDPLYTHIGVGVDVIDGKEWTTHRFMQVAPPAPAPTTTAPRPAPTTTAPAAPTTTAAPAPRMQAAVPAPVFSPAPSTTAPAAPTTTAVPAPTTTASAGNAAAPAADAGAPSAGGEIAAPAGSDDLAGGTGGTDGADGADAAANDLGADDAAGRAGDAGAGADADTVIGGAGTGAEIVALQPVALVAPADGELPLVAVLSFAVAFALSLATLGLIASELRDRKEQAAA